MGLGLSSFEHEAIVESWTDTKDIKRKLESMDRIDIRTMNSNIWDLKRLSSGTVERINSIENKIDLVNENIEKIGNFVNEYFTNKDNIQSKKIILGLLDELSESKNKEAFASKVSEIKTLIKYL